jgi:hypothetical protein
VRLIERGRWSCRRFTDPSGLAAGGDSYSLCIAHKSREGFFIVDVVRGRRRSHQKGDLDPNAVTEEFSLLCKEYGITQVTGDAYAAQWTETSWRKTGVNYVKSESNASTLYLESVPWWARGLVSIPDYPPLIRELRLLERIPGKIGRDQVCHPRGVHDDLANSVCGCLAMLASGESSEWMRPENLRRVNAEIAMRPPNPKYAQHRGPGRYMQERHSQFWERQLGERRYAQLRRGIVPGRGIEK